MRQRGKDLQEGEVYIGNERARDQGGTSDAEAERVGNE